MFLFGGDEQYRLLKKLRDAIGECDVSAMTPVEALNMIDRLKKEITEEEG